MDAAPRSATRRRASRTSTRTSTRSRASDDPYVQLALALAPHLAAIRAAAGRRTAPSSCAAGYLSPSPLCEPPKGKAIYPDANAHAARLLRHREGVRSRGRRLPSRRRPSLRGVLEKERGVEPFATPKKVLDGGPGAGLRPAGPTRCSASVPVDFLTDGDTTGGNSGSPTMNGSGEVVGLNFDRVWENVAGDFGWNPERSRNVTSTSATRSG